MHIPYSDTGWLELDSETEDEISLADTMSAKLRIVRSFLDKADITDPYELFGIVFDGSIRRIAPESDDVILEYIRENASQWEDDKTVCFVLEAATDVAGGILRHWLFEIAMPSVNELNYAGLFIREQFWEADDRLIVDLCRHHGWHREMAIWIRDELEQLDDDFSRRLYEIAAEMAENRMLDAKPRNSIAGQIVLAEFFVSEGRYFDAIDLVLGLDILPSHVLFKYVVDINMKCYVALGWHGVAMEWALKYQQVSETDELPEVMQIVEIDVYRSYFDRIRGEICRGYNWHRDSLQVLIVAEFFYRTHGRMIGDYGAIAAGYSRAIEMELRTKLLPQLRKWIAKYGLINDKNGKKYILSRDEKIYEDTPERNVMLGMWAALFAGDDAQAKSPKPGDFYYCIRCAYGATISPTKLRSFGTKLGEIAETRNVASHDILIDWERLIVVREFTQNMHEAFKTTLKQGSILNVNG